MTREELLEYAQGICEKEIEEDIKSNTFAYRFDKLQGLKRGLYIAIEITERNWTEDRMMNFIKDMIENI